MDRRKLIVMYIANELEMENYFICMMMITLMYMFVAWHYERNIVNKNQVFENHQTRLSLVNRLLESDVFCISQLRMDRRTLAILCELLRHDENIKKDGLVTLEEQVCIFLHILAHHAKNRTIVSRFYRSGETISRYFNSVLSAVLRLHQILFKKSDPVLENCTDNRWKMFKVCH